MAIGRARKLSRADLSTFAARLRSILDTEGPTVTAALVTSWEEGDAVPPATVLLAVAAVAGVEVELLFCRRTLLARLYELERQVRHQSQQLRGLQQRVTCG
jgi:transcriptional regulator with XRE-family HTH domain